RPMPERVFRIRRRRIEPFAVRRQHERRAFDVAPDQKQEVALRPEGIRVVGKVLWARPPRRQERRRAQPLTQAASPFHEHAGMRGGGPERCGSHEELVRERRSMGPVRPNRYTAVWGRTNAAEHGRIAAARARYGRPFAARASTTARGFRPVVWRQPEEKSMSFHLAKTIASAASAGLVAGALAACSSSQSKGAHGPSAAGQSTAGAEAKNCCKGKNECKGKGQCATASH